MFELLVSADAVVADHDTAVAQCQEEWGLPEVHRNWTAAPPGAGSKWSFARLQRDRRLAPTAFEILGIPYQAPGPDEQQVGYAYLPEIAAEQGDRPVRNHSTVVSTQDLDGTVARLTATGGDFRLDPPNEQMPFPRLWVGFSDAHPDRYDPRTDGGLRIEVLPHAPLGMPDPVLAADTLRATDTVPLEPGAPVRIVARTLLVTDLDAVLLALGTHFDWHPASDHEGSDGVRRARFSFSYPGSAVLEVAQPDGTSAEGKFLDAWGPGPFSVRIAVNGLAALQDRFASADVPHELLPPAGEGHEHRLMRPPERVLGTALEFVEGS